MKKLLVFVSVFLTIYSAVIVFPAFSYGKGLMNRYAAQCQSNTAINMFNSVVDANSTMGKWCVSLMIIQMFIVLGLAYLTRKKHT